MNVRGLTNDFGRVRISQPVSAGGRCVTVYETAVIILTKSAVKVCYLDHVPNLPVPVDILQIEL